MTKSLLASSVKARVALFTLTIFLVSMVCLALYVSTLLRSDLKALLASQQYATARHMAEEIEANIQTRFSALEQVADLVGGRASENDVQGQRILNDLPVFQNLFNGGTFITDKNGTAIATVPVDMPRVGVSFADRDYVQQVLSTGQPAIGRPTMGRALGEPVIVMAAPIRGDDGEIVGVLAGVTNLNKQSFLDRVRVDWDGRIGDYLLISAQHRMIIASTDKTRVMEVLPEPGISPVIDRFISGFEGTTTFVNPVKVEVLASIKQLPTARWYVAVALPTDQAFAPANALQQRMLLAIGLLTLTAALLSWWMIRRQLSPLQDAAGKLAALTPDKLKNEALQPLPVGPHDEIGQLIMSFNTLLAELARQRSDLQKSELLYSTAFQTSPDAFSITRIDDGRYLKVNESFTRIFGWRAEDLIGHTSTELGIWWRIADRMALIDAVTKRGRCENLECEMLSKDNQRLSVQVSATLIDFEGVPCMLAVTHDISGRKAAQAQIERLSITDPLTALPNRRLFMDRLDQAVGDCRRHERRGALYFVDLDDFKSLNDNLGHDKGDLLLRAAGQQLQGIVEAGDTVARLGGDEFVVLLKDLPADPALAGVQARLMGERILATLGEAFHVEGVEHHSSASVGMALFGPDMSSPSDLVKQADLALYHAKSMGRGKLSLFTPDMQQSLSSRAELEAALRTAVKEEQFRLYYQVKVNEEGHIFGVEGLLRWPHPVKGMVSPAEFIPLAEKSGLIVPLGQWVIQEACRQLAAWAKDPVLATLTLGVNVSSRQFQQPDFVDVVRHALQDTGANARRLKLELTESLLVDNIQDVAGKMKALRDEGVCFSLDDFGTGFSSLAYLKSLPLDELKIDQGFVRDIEADPNDLAIAGTIVALGNSLGLAVTAEGVETEAQRQALEGLGCRRYQGYLFGRPSPVADIEACVRAQERVAEDA